MGAIELTEYLPEPGFPFRGAMVIDAGGELIAGAWLGSLRAVITTKPSLLEAGIASCCPYEPHQADAWPFSVRAKIEGVDQLLEYATADPAVVAAARKFNQLANAGELKEGMAL